MVPEPEAARRARVPAGAGEARTGTEAAGFGAEAAGAGAAGTGTEALEKRPGAAGTGGGRRGRGELGRAEGQQCLFTSLFNTVGVENTLECHIGKEF